MLFTSTTKYNSGCGWPAFYAPGDNAAVKESRDLSHGMVRTEITCSKCGIIMFKPDYDVKVYECPICGKPYCENCIDQIE